MFVALCLYQARNLSFLIVDDKIFRGYFKIITRIYYLVSIGTYVIYIYPLFICCFNLKKKKLKIIINHEGCNIFISNIDINNIPTTSTSYLNTTINDAQY